MNDAGSSGSSGAYTNRPPGVLAGAAAWAEMVAEVAAPVTAAVAFATAAAAALAWRGARADDTCEGAADAAADLTQDARVWALGAFAVAALLPHLVVGILAHRVAGSSPVYGWYDAACLTRPDRIPGAFKVVAVLAANAALHLAVVYLALPYCIGAASLLPPTPSPSPLPALPMPMPLLPMLWTDASAAGQWVFFHVEAALRLGALRAVAVVFFGTAFDFTAYCGHRLMHLTTAGMRVHELHHSVKADHTWNAWYMHPVDSFLENTAPHLVGPLLWRRLVVGPGGAGADLVAMTAFFFIYELDTVKAHAGCHLGFLGGGGYHHFVHHQSHKCNYSNAWCDKLFGTFRGSHLVLAKPKRGGHLTQQ